MLYAYSVQMGAGIIPAALDSAGTLHFLFGQEAGDGYWGDFGGGREGRETQFQTAIREGCEELDGFLGCERTLAKLVRNNRMGIVGGRQYRTYLFGIEYDDKLPTYFNNHHKFIEKHTPFLVDNKGLFEKSQIKWFTIADLRTARSSFRPFYRKIISEIIART